MLYWNTVNNLLKDSLLTLMQADVLKDFRLVGGTALSLHLGHRLSVDIDLFTDADYGSVDFKIIEDFLINTFPYVQGDFNKTPGMGKSYLIGTDPTHVVKLDVYYSMDPFFQNVIEVDAIRLATVEEIIAMKIDVIQREGRKKDFWDLHEVLTHYTIKDMIHLHKQRFLYTHDHSLIQQNMINFRKADTDFDPVCLKGKYWEFIKEDIEAAAAR
ncbi:MAG: nucleotidyl transferase AbiEii/AbiGii toxin family protein [Cytophaga sp.]|uniref:nucleotidyl transferase AbiEii/AbiGii toxin family protein n=1 Tax=Cytophaga sp. TaxID=29535 RepID=UPI003F7FCE09